MRLAIGAIHFHLLSKFLRQVVCSVSILMVSKLA